MKLQDYLRVLRKRWRWLAASMVIGALAAIAITLTATPQYQATSQIFVASGEISTTGELAQGSTFAQNRVKSYVQVISSDLVLAPVGQDLGLPVAALTQQVKATVPTDTVLIDITVTDPSPAQAATIANAIAQRFPQVARSIEPNRADQTPAVTVTVTEQASVPTTPISPRMDLNIGLGLLAGVLLGLLLMALREALDTRLKGEREVTGVTTVPVLGRIPLDKDAKTRPLVVCADPNSPQAEAYRQLRTNLQFVASAGRGRTILITSSVPGEGKSASAVNLAISMAEAGSRVCLVEADLRRPGVGRYLDLEAVVGLTTVLIGAVDLSDALQPWGSGNLHVLMSGQRPPNPSEMLSGPAMGELLDSLQNQYDIVIIDSAPLLPVTDSAVLASRCAAVVVVVGTGQVRRRELQRSLSDLEAVGAPVVGVLLTKVPSKGPDGAGLKTYAYQAPAETDFRVDETKSKKKVRRNRSDRRRENAAAPDASVSATPRQAGHDGQSPVMASHPDDTLPGHAGDTPKADRLESTSGSHR